MVVVEGERGDDIMAGNNPFLTFEPFLFFQPQTHEELQLILKEARLQMKAVKAAGMYSSPNDMAFTSGFAVSMEKFDKLIEINIRARTITVEAGMTLSQLSKITHQYGMALPVMPLQDATIGGALSVGYIGMATKSACISSYVLEFELLLGDGMTVTCNHETNRQLFNVASVSLGALGIILSVKLQCIQSYVVSISSKLVPLNLIMTTLSHDGTDQLTSICYDLSSKKCVVRRAHQIRTNQEKCLMNPIKGSVAFSCASSAWVYCCQLLFIASSIFPFLTELLSRLTFVFVWSTYPPNKFIHSSDLQSLNVSLGTWPSQATEICEWAIERGKVGDLIHRLRTTLEERNMKMQGSVCFRFCRSDHHPMSLVYNTDMVLASFSVIRSVIMSQSKVDAYFNLVTELCCSVKGRPNWAKPHTVTSEYISRVYDSVPLFMKVRQQLDPGGTFLNRFLRQRFNTNIVNDGNRRSDNKNMSFK